MEKINKHTEADLSSYTKEQGFGPEITKALWSFFLWLERKRYIK
jgi:hypothetical protein